MIKSHRQRNTNLDRLDGTERKFEPRNSTTGPRADDTFSIYSKAGKIIICVELRATQGKEIEISTQANP
jgi:hypothetical protein